MLALSASLSSSGWGQDLARGLHLLGAVIAFGAVLLVDWYGLVWISGLRTFRETLRVSEAAFPLVWLGLILLLVSGVFLAPDLGAPLT